MKYVKLLLTVAMLFLLFSFRQANDYADSPFASDATVCDKYVEVIAYRELHLLEGVDNGSFEKFVREKLVPTFEQHVPGVTVKVMKGERGEKKGIYVLLLIFDSINTRNFYFPTEQHGETNMPEAALKLWRPGHVMLIEEVDAYIEPLEENLFTDFDVLK